MESTRSIVKKPFFTRALSFFKTDELLSLRNLSKSMNETVRNYHLRHQNLKLHESSFRPSISDYIKTAKKMTIDGITLTDKTKEMFDNLPDKIYESIESLELNFMSEEENQEISEYFAKVLSQLHKLSQLKVYSIDFYPIGVYNSYGLHLKWDHF